MAIGALLALGYLAALVATREWRATTHLLVTRTPWRAIARSAFDAFPSSRWRGTTRLLGMPLAWCFAALVFVLMALVLTAIEIAFSPRAIHCLAVRLSHRCREWWSGPPNGTPPRSVALAMSKPEPPLLVDAVSRVRNNR